MLALILMPYFVASEIKLSFEVDTLTITGNGNAVRDEFIELYKEVVDDYVKKLIVTGNVFSLDYDVFSDASYLSTIESAELLSIYYLSDNVFNEYKQLSTVTFGKNIKYIGENFRQCEFIHLNIPASVERVNPKLLRWIDSFTLDSKNTHYSVCNSTENTYLLYPNKSLIFGIAGTNIT